MTIKELVKQLVSVEDQDQIVYISVGYHMKEVLTVDFKEEYVILDN